MKTLVQILFKTLSFFLSILWDGLLILADALGGRRGFNARFGYEHSIASRFNFGFLVTRNGRLSRRQSFENLLVCGGTGSGKTSKILIPNLLQLKNCSLLINDPSKELYLKCSGYLSKYFDIRVLNFSDTASSGYNILSRVRSNTDVQKLADLLTKSTVDRGNNDPFWGIKTKEVLSVLIRLSLYQPKKYRNMANVLDLLNHLISSPETIDRLVVRTRDKKLLIDYKSIIAASDKVLQSILSNTKAGLQVFDDEMTAKVTAFDSIDFESLRARPTIIFLHNSIADQAYYSTLNAIVFQQFYSFILTELPRRSDLDIFIILEEASSLYVPVLPLALDNCRKYRVGTIIAIQAPEQLKTLYKNDAENIVNNCITKLYMPGLTAMDTLRELETFSGKTFYKDPKGVERIRPLLTIEDARMLNKNRSLIVHSNLPIIKGRTRAYFRSLRYKAYCSLPTMQLINRIPSRPVPLITEQLQTIPA